MAQDGGMGSLMDKILGRNKDTSNSNNTNNSNSNNQQQPNNINNPNTNSNTNANGNEGNASGILNGMAGQNADDKNSKNPLDAYKGIFDNANKKEADKPPTFSIPDDALNEVAGKMNFLSGINEELLTKARTGDVGALMDLVNEVGRNAYKANMQHMSMLSNNFVDSRLAHDSKSLGSRVKNELTQSELSNTITGFDHPVVKAQLVTIARQLSQEHPDATAQEIAAQAKNYIIELSKAINPEANSAQDKSTAKAGETDWENYY
jgi:hypothetical protein